MIMLKIIKKLIRILFYLIPSFIRKPLNIFLEKQKTIGSKNYNYHKKIAFRQKGNYIISNALQKEEPILIARIGHNELNCIDFYHNNRPENYPEDLLDRCSNNAGIYPKDEKIFDKFSEIYIDAISNTDVMAVWNNKGEPEIVEKFCPSSYLIGLSSIDSYLYKKPWSLNLRNKKVLVISPFDKTIEKQYQKRELLFEDKDILPEFNLITYKAVQAMGGGNDNFPSWIEAYEKMCRDVEKIDFDIAIISAGAFGLPLASFCKKQGKQAVHMGGAAQLLFGIKGGRWDKMPKVKAFYNDYWVNLPEESKPNNIDKIILYEGMLPYW